VELARHLLAEDLRERVGGLRAQLVLLVDRRVVGRLVEWQPERRLARRPHDPLETEPPGGGEDGVGAGDVRAEGQVGGCVHRRGDGREVHDRLDAGQLLGVAERFDGLAVVGQVGVDEGRGRVRPAGLRRGHPVHVEHIMALLEQVADDGAPGLPAASRDRDPHVRHPFIRARRSAANAARTGGYGSNAKAASALACWCTCAASARVIADGSACWMTLRP
jgi:hypothetical protein